MAKQTTDKFKVKVEFNDALYRFKHMMRHFDKELNLTQVNHDPLTCTYKLDVGFKDDKKKWQDLFYSSQWVEEYEPKIINSTPLIDEFEVTVTYVGKQKPFEKSFESTGRFTVTSSLISSKTKNLGVLNPYSKTLTDDNKQSMAILKMFFQDAMAKTGFIKKKSVSEVTSLKEYAITVLGDRYFSHTEGERLVCIHLKNWKVGFCPFPNEMDQIKVLVSYPKFSRWHKEPSYYNLQEDAIPELKRIARIIPHKYGYQQTEYTKFFVGDPNLPDKIASWVKKLDPLPNPS